MADPQRVKLKTQFCHKNLSIAMLEPWRQKRSPVDNIMNQFFANAHARHVSAFAILAGLHVFIERRVSHQPISRVHLSAQAVNITAIHDYLDALSSIMPDAVHNRTHSLVELERLFDTNSAILNLDDAYYIAARKTDEAEDINQ